MGVVSRWEGGAGVLEPSTAKGPVLGALSAASFLPFRSHHTKTTQQSNPNFPPGTQHYSHTHTYTSRTGTHGLPSTSPEITPSPAIRPRRKDCAHRDPSRPLHVDTSSSHCGSKLSASTISPTPPESSMNQAVLDPFLRGMGQGLGSSQAGILDD